MSLTLARPPVRRSTTRRLGTGLNRALLVRSNGRRDDLKANQIQWGWKADQPASATIQTSSQLAADATAWEHEIEIHRSGELMWAGPLIGTSDQNGLATLTALDLAGWGTGTVLDTDRAYLGADWATIAHHLLVGAALDGVRVSGVDLALSGVYGSLVISGAELRTVTDALQAAAPFVDIVAVGRRIVIDGRPPTARDVVGTLVEGDLSSLSRTWTDGYQSPDVAYVKGAGGLVGRYPAASVSRRSAHHVVATSVDRSDLTTQVEVDAAARARWESQPTTPHIDVGNGRIMPGAAIGLADAFPGQLVRCVVPHLGRTVSVLARIVEVNVSQAGAVEETVSMSLSSLTT